MFHVASLRNVPLLLAVFLPTAAACGSSSSDDAAADDSDSGGVVTGAAGTTGGSAVGSTGGSDTSSGGAAGHASTGGSGGGSGSAQMDASTSGGGKSGSTPTGDAMTIDVQPDGPWKVAPLPAVGTPGVDYLSDLQPSRVSLFDTIGGASKSGPMHNDVSFTGKPLVINDVYYAKGLGVHTYAQITYTLGGAYKQFISDTGLDYLENSSTMIFEVLLDDKLSYDNGNGTKTKDQVAPVNLDVTGKQTIMLYVRDGFDDTAGDFGVWGGARLVK